MDVGNVGMRAVGRALLAIGFSALLAARAQADPLYTAIDLGTGTPTFANGTVTGSNGQTYTFNPASNDLPSAWSHTSIGVPIVAQAPVGSPETYGTPGYAYSESTLSAMNAQGLAAGIDTYGVDGHTGNSTAFLTQQQANGTWGTPIALWQGPETYMGEGAVGPTGTGILGVASNGQILGYGSSDPTSAYASPTLFLDDSRTSTLTNLSTLIDGLKWASPSQAATVPFPNWYLENPETAQLDEQGRILVQATEGMDGTTHEVLLVPQGAPEAEVAAPEPATWLVFVLLTGGCLARNRLRGGVPRE